MEKENVVLEVPIDSIIANRFQPRLEFDETSLNELAESIKQHGIIQPLVVRSLGDKYEIIAGERRFKASQIAGLSKVPVIIKNVTDDKSAQMAVLENIQRKNLTPLEEAKSYQRLLQTESNELNTQGQLAEKLGISQSTIANKLRLLGLTDEVQEALLKNKISERHARSLLALEDPQDQVSMLNKILEKRMTVKQTDEAIKEILARQTIKPLAMGEKPVEAEQITKVDESSIKSIEEAKNEIQNLHSGEKTENLNENNITKSQKIDLEDLLKIDEEYFTNAKEEVKKPKKKEQKKTKKEKRTENTEIQNIEPQPELEEKTNMTYNSQINPFQETEILNFEIPDEIGKTKKLQIEKISKIENKRLEHNLIAVINETREMVKRIEEAGFYVITEEFDLEDMYQITIKIDKDE